MSNCINLNILLFKDKTDPTAREPLISHFPKAQLDILGSIVATNNIDTSHYTDDDLLIIEAGLRNAESSNAMIPEIQYTTDSSGNKVVNINAGKNENAALSNLSARSFFIEMFDGEKRQFNSVEQAFQYIKFRLLATYLGYDKSGKKFLLSDKSIPTLKLEEGKDYTKEIANLKKQLERIRNTLNGFDAKKLGGPKGGYTLPQEFIDKVWNDGEEIALDVMKVLLKESFKQNSVDLNLLLSTGNAKLTHDIGGYWKEKFPKLLMEVREELSSGVVKTPETKNTTDDAAVNALLAKLGVSSDQVQNDQPQTDQNQNNQEQDDLKPREFKTPRPADASTITIQDRETADMEFNVRERRDRVELIARLFTDVVDLELNKQIKELEKQAAESNTDFDKVITSLKLGYYGRIDVINKLTPGKIFDKIYSYFNTYANKELNKLIETELKNITDKSLSEEERRKLATKQAENKIDAYKKLIRNRKVFEILCTEASRKLIFTEGIVCDPFTLEVSKPNLATMEENGVSVIDNTSDSSSKEESVKDGWMTHFRNISNLDSLSMEVRRVLSKIPKIIHGNTIERDDLGHKRYLDPHKVHVAVMNALKNMDSVDDMIPLLERASKASPYLKRVIRFIENNEELKSKFYQNFRKDTTNYWIQVKRVNKDGSTTYITKQVNKQEGINTILSNIRGNYESNTRLTEYSVYGFNGVVNKKNAEKVSELISKLISKIQSIIYDNDTTSNYDFAGNINSLLNNKEFFRDYTTILKSLGIEVDPERLKALLAIDSSFNPNDDYLVIKGLLQAAGEITDGIIKGKVKDEITEDGEKVPGDLIHTYEYQYKKIAYALAFTTDDDVEDSTYENGKSYYSHNKPSYCKKIINRLKNVRELSDKKYKEFIHEEYELDPWFYDEKTGTEYNVWLKLLKENPDMRNLLDHKVVLHSNKVEYDKWDDLDTLIALYSEYNAGTGLEETSGPFAWYHMPVLSDATSAEFIKFIKYTGSDYQKQIIENFRRLVNQEVRRIGRVNERYEKIKKDELKPIANYDRTKTSIGGAEFKFLPALNTYRKDGKLFLDKLDELLNDKTKTSNDINSFIDECLSDILNRSFEKAFTKWVNDGILTKTLDNAAYKYLPFNTKDYTDDSVKESFREFYYNSKFAQSQIIQLLTTDLAFYKNTTDFIKRIKEVHSPALKLNTKATFKGERVGKDYENVVYLKDIKVESSIIGDIEKVFRARGFNEDEIKSIVDKYRNVNVADAQAYRSLKSYREIMIMAGTWGGPEGPNETAYQHLMSNTWTKEDFNVVWQSIKPFMYTQIMQDDPTGGKLKVPVQHKNSEFLLLAATVLNSPVNQSPVLRALNEFMDENQIDCVMFESAVKVGCQGPIQIDEKDGYKIKETLTKYIMKNGEQNPEVVHTIPYEDYGIQVENPQHAVDAMNLIGTQQRKLGVSDISDDADVEFTIRGKKFTKKEIIDLYNEIIVDNQAQDADELEKIFYDQKSISQEIRKQLVGSVKYSADLLKACTLDDNDNFVMPLFEGSQSVRVQALLYSIIKSRQVKQRIKGGSFVQTSCFGLERKPKIVFDYSGKKPRVKYIECYIPCYDSRLYELLYDEKTGTLDVEKLPEELRWINGIRIPTEDKYSTFPLRIIGFTPSQNGNVIILPEEVTVITGSDFDFDKDYVSFPEFDVKINYKRFKELVLKNPGFKKWGKDNVQMTIDMIINGNIHFEPNSPEEHILRYFNDIKDDLKEIIPIKYNFEDKTKNGRKARNNLYIEILNSVLTNSDTAYKLLNPGGMDAHKRASKILSILNNVPIKEIKKYLVSKNKMDENVKPKDLVTLLMDSKALPLDVIEDLAKSVAVAPDPLSPTTYIDYHNKNMAGNNLIGIYANQSSNHAVSQHSEMEIKDFASFILGGEVKTSLHGIKAIDGQYISRYLAGFIQAAVDNAKELVLYDLNQNTYTADVTGLLTRLGYDPFIIGALLNQPIIKDIVTGYIRDTREGVSKETVVKNVIKKYAEKSGASIPDYGAIRKAEIPFTLKDLLTNIIIYNNRDKSNLGQDFYKKQVEVGVLFTQILVCSEKIGDLIHATKADTSNGSAGPTIGDTTVMIDRLIDLNIAGDKDSYPISGINFIRSISVQDDDGPLEIQTIKKGIMKSPVPFIQGFYTFGLTKTIDLLEQYFPFNSPRINAAVLMLRDLTKTGKLTADVINDIYSNILLYELSKTKFFGEEDGITAEEKREYYMNKFPNDFIQLKLKYAKELKDNELIQGITYSNPNKKHPTGLLVFNKVGGMTEILKDSYKQDSVSLLYSNNEKLRNLVFDLVKYSYFRGSLGFTPDGFGNLISIDVLLSINEYASTLYELLNSGGTTFNYERFAEQYVLNHLHNTKFAPLIDVVALSNSNIPIIENNQLVDEFNIDRTVKVNNIPAGLDNVVKNIVIVDGEKLVDFMNFINIKYNNKDNFYIYNSEEGSYVRIQKLGLKNNFLEYDSTKDADEMTSMVRDMFTENIKRAETAAASVAEKYDKLYEQNVLNSNNDSNSGSYDGIIEVNGTKIDTNAAINQAVNLKYGTQSNSSTSNDTQGSDKTITNYKPVNDLKDADGKPLCGAKDSGSIIEF